MTRPALAAGKARLHVYDRDGTTSRGLLAGEGLSWVHSKALDGSSVSVTANMLEAAMASDPTMLEDTLAVVELDIGGVWTPIGTAYTLAPGSGTVVGDAEGAAAEAAPVGAGALALASEWLVLHSGGVVNRRGPTDRYIGWQSLIYTEDAGWHDADQVTPASLTILQPKYGEPFDWPKPAAAASWVYRDPAEGGLTLFRYGTFTVTVRQKYLVGFSCDEEAKVYLDGPGQGGVILETSDQETGYTIKNLWRGVLEPGTYLVAAEMTTIDTPGGDGFDASRLFVATVDKKGHADTVVLMSGAGTRVHRQPKSSVRPGPSVGAVVDLIRTENETWGIPSASLLVPDFTAAVDSDAATWPAGEERVWSVGTSGAQVLADLEIDATFDVSTGFDFQAWADRGGATSAALTPGADPPTAGMNLSGYGYTSDPVTGTRAVVLTQDGFVEVIDGEAEAVTEPRGVFLESAASGSVGKGIAYGRDSIRQSGRIRRSYSAEMIAVTGSIPEVDFGVCDPIAGLDYTAAPLSLQVLSIAGSNAETRVAWTLELADPAGFASVTLHPAGAQFPSGSTFPGA